MKAAFNKGKDRIINAVATENMLRYLPSKTARHTIKRSVQVNAIRSKTATDTLSIYTRDVLPRIEEGIERRLLQKYVSGLPSVEEQKEVFEAYDLRKHELSLVEGTLSGAATQNEDSLESLIPNLGNFSDGVQYEYTKNSPEKVQELKDMT